MKISGTREWASETVNILLGCEHQCRYCYACSNALRFKKIKDVKEWGTTYKSVRQSEVIKGRKKLDGTVMFPTTHDITPEFLEECKTVLNKLLEAGNKVLIVSKPHIQCIEVLCEDLKEFKDQILFRFTIGASNDEILSYWEPNAPGFDERFSCLQHAFNCGFKTSVSAEPMLDSSEIVELFYVLEPYVTDSIWIGKMNRVRNRVIISTVEDDQQVSKIEDGQTDERIWEIYNDLKNEPKVKWKESIKEVVDIPLAKEKGLDE